MSKLLEHNTFKDRFRQSDSIRMHEFIYPFLQAYDSIHLHADIELGGTDQLFNIAFGRELQKEYGQYPQAALLMPILSGTDGVRKMSKSLDNYIGVLEAPKTMEQKLLNMPDANIVDYLKLLTPLPPEEVREIEKSLSGSPSTRTILECKHRLIDEILAIYHPQTDRNRTEVLSIPKDECKEDGLPVLKALHLAGFAKSNREAFGFLKSGAVKVDGEKITDRNISLHLEKGPVDLALGKKKRVRIELDSR
jgi:tyrosyl-tRNA synthetase